jgi:hypothetical protein
MNITGLVTDLGVGGCYVDTQNPLAEGTEVEIRFSSVSGTFRCRGFVAYAVFGEGMGLVFTETAPDQEISVLDWVSRFRQSGYGQRLIRGEAIGGLDRREGE